VAACWSDSAWLPTLADRQFQQLADSRAALNLEAPGADTSFAGNRVPCSAAAVLMTVPSALIHGLLAPWPQDWWRPELGTAVSAALTFEMLVLYGGLVALFWQGHRLARPGLLLPLAALSLATIALFAVALPNLGTLMRMRYGPLLLLIGLGLAAAIAAGRRRHPAIGV
jgi:hypothetical protein